MTENLNKLRQLLGNQDKCIKLLDAAHATSGYNTKLSTCEVRVSSRLAQLREAILEGDSHGLMRRRKEMVVGFLEDEARGFDELIKVITANPDISEKRDPKLLARYRRDREESLAFATELHNNLVAYAADISADRAPLPAAER